MAWLDLAASVRNHDARSYNLILRLGGSIFPEHYVGAIGDMHHPTYGPYDEEPEAIWGEDDDAELVPYDLPGNLLFEATVHTLAIGKRKGWTL